MKTILLSITLALIACKEQEKSEQVKLDYSADSPATGFIDDRDGKKYKTVQIGEQIWMAENLNYNADSSLCYDNKPENCNIYGRLYNWEMAMNACPKGWRLPRKIDWNILMSIIGDSLNAGKKLKAMSGWKINGNGTDNYGFSALPGGLKDGEHFGYAGYYGFWWFIDGEARIFLINNYKNTVRTNSLNRFDRFSIRTNSFSRFDHLSIRCLKDTVANAATAKPIEFDSATIANHAKIAEEQARLDSIETLFIDSRDGKKYRTTQMNNQIWMAENLNYNVKGSKCHDDKPENCDKYGRLYNWHAAFRACPKGWHLPRAWEWQDMFQFVEENCSKSAKGGWTVGKHLLASSENIYGFSALEFGEYNTYWWTATEDDRRFKDKNAPLSAEIWGLNKTNDLYTNMTNFYSVRCVKNYDHIFPLCL